MSYVRLWVHLVFSTKNRAALLKKEIRPKVYDHIVQNCKEKDILLKAINGYTEHLHCLISLGKDQTISKVAQLIKGESSFWINKHGLTSEKFLWQDDYFAISVSESKMPQVFKYIQQQEIHHQKKTFAEEVDEFVQKHGWEYDFKIS